jgi:hypothetical protein
MDVRTATVKSRPLEMKIVSPRWMEGSMYGSVLCFVIGQCLFFIAPEKRGSAKAR